MKTLPIQTKAEFNEVANQVEGLRIALALCAVHLAKPYPKTITSAFALMALMRYEDSLTELMEEKMRRLIAFEEAGET